MNTERFNPHLDQHTRTHKPPQLNFENKENNAYSDMPRDGYTLNNPHARWGDKNGRTYFAALNNIKKR